MSQQHLSISGISQLLLTQFLQNFKGRFLGPFLTDADNHNGIFPGIEISTMQDKKTTIIRKQPQNNWVLTINVIIYICDDVSMVKLEKILLLRLKKCGINLLLKIKTSTTSTTNTTLCGNLCDKIRSRRF